VTEPRFPKTNAKFHQKSDELKNRVEICSHGLIGIEVNKTVGQADVGDEPLRNPKNHPELLGPKSDDAPAYRSSRRDTILSSGPALSTSCAKSDHNSSISRHLSSGLSDRTSGSLSRSIRESYHISDRLSTFGCAGGQLGGNAEPV
jgi:hypothetical protein